MADEGTRSVEINITNMTSGDFTVQGVSTSGSGVGWIKGEEATQGQSIPLYQAVKFGIMTDDYNASISAQITLTGVGDPVVIAFAIDNQGNASCTVPSTRGTATQVQTGERDHAEYNVTLNAVMAHSRQLEKA